MKISDYKVKDLPKLENKGIYCAYSFAYEVHNWLFNYMFVKNKSFPYEADIISQIGKGLKQNGQLRQDNILNYHDNEGDAMREACNEIIEVCAKLTNIAKTKLAESKMDSKQKEGN